MLLRGPLYANAVSAAVILSVCLSVYPFVVDCIRMVKRFVRLSYFAGTVADCFYSKHHMDNV